MNFPEDTKVKGLVVADMGGSGSTTGVHAVAGRCRLMSIQWRKDSTQRNPNTSTNAIAFRDGSTATDTAKYEMLVWGGSQANVSPGFAFPGFEVFTLYLGGHGILFNDGIFVNVGASPQILNLSIFYAGGGEPA